MASNIACVQETLFDNCRMLSDEQKDGCCERNGNEIASGYEIIRDELLSSHTRSHSAIVGCCCGGPAEQVDGSRL